MCIPKIVPRLLFILTLSLPQIGAGNPVGIGATYDEVLEAIGKPDGILNAGSKQILTYGQATIKLKQGKVYWISPELDHSLVERQAQLDAIEKKRHAGLVNVRGQWVTPAQRDAITQAENKARQKEMAQIQATSPLWLTNFNQALALAKSQNKLLLLNFTGSDWCGWCKKLDAEVFSTPQFQHYAADHYILVKIDFPKRTKLSAEQQQQNEQLARKFKITGFPTIVVLKPSGKIYKVGGYVAGGPDAFLDSIQ